MLLPIMCVRIVRDQAAMQKKRMHNPFLGEKIQKLAKIHQTKNEGDDKYLLFPSAIR